MADRDGWPDPLVYTDADGRKVTADLPPRYDGAARGANLQTRLLQPDQWLLCRRVADPKRISGQQALDLLDNEIRIATRLAHHYAAGYPRELARLVGYHMDVEQPYLLMEIGPRARPVAEVAGQLSLEHQERFLVDLMRGLALLHGARLVHRGIGPQTVWWDGEHAQIADFSLGVPRGAARTPLGSEPWHPHDQVIGKGAAASSDDVWSAGVLAVYVATGRLPSDGGRGQDMIGFGGGVSRALQGVFAADVSRRPKIREILLRLDAEMPAIPRVVAADPKFVEGQRQYDHIRLRKNPDAPQDAAFPAAEEEPAEEPPRPQEPPRAERGEEPEPRYQPPVKPQGNMMMGVMVAVLVFVVIGVFAVVWRMLA